MIFQCIEAENGWKRITFKQKISTLFPLFTTLFPFGAERERKREKKLICRELKRKKCVWVREWVELACANEKTSVEKWNRQNYSISFRDSARHVFTILIGSSKNYRKLNNCSFVLSENCHWAPEVTTAKHTQRKHTHTYTQSSNRTKQLPIE